MINKRSKKKGKQDYLDTKDREVCKERTSICEKCSEQPATELHHIRTKASNPDLRHEPTNHLWVCHDCHLWFHANILDGWQWVIDNGLDGHILALQAMVNLKRGIK